MSKYKKLQLAALAVELITLVVRGCHGLVAPLPDWAVRLDGVVMLAACAVIVFASVRLKICEDS